MHRGPDQPIDTYVQANYSKVPLLRQLHFKTYPHTLCCITQTYKSKSWFMKYFITNNNDNKKLNNLTIRWLSEKPHIHGHDYVTQCVSSINSGIQIYKSTHLTNAYR